MDFFDQFRELVQKTPRRALLTRNSQNADFSDGVTRSKNIYLGFDLQECEDCLYVDHCRSSKKLVDCSFVSHSSLCYECISCSYIETGKYLEECHNGSNLAYCYDCQECRDCFGCVGLRGKRFYIFNKPYEPIDYYQKIASLLKKPHATLLQEHGLIRGMHPRINLRRRLCDEASLGDSLTSSIRVFKGFNSAGATASGYLFDLGDATSKTQYSYDIDGGSNLSWCYDLTNVHDAHNVRSSLNSSECRDSEYLIDCYNCRSCFGCVGLEGVEHAILNVQYTPFEYEQRVSILKRSLRLTGSYGKTLASAVSGGL